MPITFDDVRETMPEKAAKDDKTIERALSVLPARVLLLMEPDEMGVVVHRFDARMRQASRGDADSREG